MTGAGFEINKDAEVGIKKKQGLDCVRGAIFKDFGAGRVNARRYIILIEMLHLWSILLEFLGYLRDI